MPVLILIALYLAGKYRRYDREQQQRQLFMPAAIEMLRDIIVLHLYLIVGVGFLTVVLIFVMLYV